MKKPRLLIVVDKKNPRAVEQAIYFKQFEDKDPNFILVAGGDGFMLDTMRKYLNWRLPFIGVNSGHVGFLLNDPRAFKDGFPREVKLYTLPLLEVETILVNGKIKRMVAINDVWVERANSQGTSIEVKVEGVVRIPRLVSDGILVATPTGSTAYARSMGASPVPLDAQVLVLVGSNVFSPRDFGPCYLPISSVVEFSNLDNKKRPLIGMVDGIKIIGVQSMRISISQNASVQLANAGDHGLPEKLLGIQFPKIT